MDQDKPLINRVANSGLITINLEEYFPSQEIVTFDIKDYLFKEMILKEKDFRTALKELDWNKYEEKILLVDCSVDAIIPLWAYMLITAHASPFAKEVFHGSQEDYLKLHYDKAIDALNLETHEGKRIVIKGCSTKPVPASAYMKVTQKLRPYAQSIMFGEPCSTVPIFKRPRIIKK